MTTHAQRPALGGPGNGGVAARRAVVRWAGRMFRREWRQQILVVTLLAVAVTAAIGRSTLVRSSGAEPDNAAECGSANSILTFDGSNPRKLQAGLDSLRRSVGTIDVIGPRSVPVPGGVSHRGYRAR